MTTVSVQLLRNYVVQNVFFSQKNSAEVTFGADMYAVADKKNVINFQFDFPD